MRLPFFLYLWAAASCTYAQAPFNQLKFCEDIDQSVNSSFKNFIYERFPDRNATELTTSIESYGTNHLGIVRGDDSTYINFFYQVHMYSNRQREAKEDLDLFISRLQSCNSLVTWNIVATGELFDSLRPAPGSPERYNDLTMSVRLTQYAKKDHYWMYISMNNRPSEYSRAQELAETQARATGEQSLQGSINHFDNDFCSVLRRIIKVRDDYSQFWHWTNAYGAKVAML